MKPETVARYKEEGLCFSCGKPTESSLRYCKKHTEGRYKLVREWGKKVLDLGGGYFVTQKRASVWWTKYRHRPEDVLIMYLDQDARCAICGDYLAWDEVFIDHDHNHPGARHLKSGNCQGCSKESVRGLVHDYCNIGLGSFRESIERLQGAIRYLGGVAC